MSSDCASWLEMFDSSGTGIDVYCQMPREHDVGPHEAQVPAYCHESKQQQFEVTVTW